MFNPPSKMAVLGLCLCVQLHDKRFAGWQRRSALGHGVSRPALKVIGR
jgi:hypothetical protein